MTHKLSQSLPNIHTFPNKSTYAEVRDEAPEYAQAALQHYLAQRLRTTALPQPHPLPLHCTSSFLQVLQHTFRVVVLFEVCVVVGYASYSDCNEISQVQLYLKMLRLEHSGCFRRADLSGGSIVLLFL